MISIMNNITNISKWMMRASLLLMVFLAQPFVALAQDEAQQPEFYLETGLTIAKGETKEVSLMLDNTETAYGLQATLELPTGLTYVDRTVAKTSRIAGGRTVNVDASIESGKLVILMTNGTVAAGEGAVITFQVTADASMKPGVYPIELSEIVVSDKSGYSQLNEVEAYTAQIEVLGMLQCNFAAPQSFEIAAGQQYQVDVTLNNAGVNNLAALSGKLTLPEGLEIVPGEDGDFIYSDRIPLRSVFSFSDEEVEENTNAHFKRFVLSSTQNEKITGTDGVIFSFIVEAKPVLAETSEIKLDELRVAATTGESQECPEVKITVTNTSETLWAEIEGKLADIEAMLDAANTAMEGNEDETIVNALAAASEAFTALSEKFNDAHVAGTLGTLDFDTEAQPTIDAIKAIVPAAELLAEIATMQEALDAIEFTEDDVFADDFASLTESKGDIQDAIDNLSAWVKEQSEAAALTDESTLPENTVVEDTEALATALETAMAAKAASDANDAKKTELTEEIAALQEALDAIVISEEELFADDFTALTAAKGEIQDAIDELSAWVEEQAEAIALTDESVLPENTVADDIEALAADLATAKAAKEAKDVNDAKKEALSSEIAALQETLNAIEINEEELLAEDFVTLTETLAAIQEAIDELASWVEEQAEATALTAESVLPENTVAEDTEALVAAVEAAEAAKDAKDVNDAKKEALSSEIAALQETLNAIEINEEELLAEDFVTLTETLAAIQEAIDELSAWVEEQAEATALTAESVLPENTVAEETEALVAAIEAAQAAKVDNDAFEAYKTTQITAVEALAQEGDSEAAQQIIADAVADIEALEYDEDMTLEENEEVVDAIVAAVEDDLAEQRAADQLAADEAAFEDYKAEQVDAVEALAEVGDSEDAQAIIADAVAAIEATEYDEEMTLEENKAVVDALVAPVAEALAAQRAAEALAADKAAFDDYKAEQIEAVEALAEDGDNEVAQQIIADAVAAIEELEYDESKSLEENKAAVDAIVEPVADALATVRDAQLAADKAAFAEYKTDAKTAADALAEEEDSEASQALIADAKDAIEALTYDEEKSLDENIEAVDAILADLEDDLEAQRSEDNETAYVALSEELDELYNAIAEAREALADSKYALVADEYLAMLDELQEEVDAAREDLEERYENGELTLSSTNIESITQDEVAAVIAAADAAQTDVAGDIDNDGEITLDDFDSFVDELLTNDDLWDAADDPELYEQYKKYDVNGDGSIDVADAQALINLALGLNIDGTLRHNVRSMTGDASQILAAQTIQMGNGVTRYIINLNESSNYASFQMKVTGNVVNMSSENASLRTKETADGYRVLGFAKNNAFNGSELLVIDVKGVAQFSNITLATLNATSVAGMLDDATGIVNVTIDESEARYDLSGKKLNKQTTGVNIVRGADGKVRKVMVK